MKTPFKLSTLALAAALLSGAQVQAASIADTGTPSGNSFPLELGGASWLAGQIDVSTATSIQSIQAYLNDMGAGGSFTVALYGDSAAHLPGNMLGSWAANFATPAGADGWNGVSGLDFAVQAGKYWVALEVQGSDTFSGVAPVGAPLPLAKYAFNDGGFAGYQAMPNAFGVQVTAVPEPEAFAMMLAGLALIGGIARRRSRQV
jgi:hypothetical protein